jgi:phosphatidate cytidylyltransferase
VALPLLILLILKGSPVLFTSLVLLLSFIGLTEFYGMALPQRRFEGLLAAAVGAFLPCSLLPGSDPLIFPAYLTLLLLLFSLHFLFRFRDIKAAAGETALVCFGFLYVPLLLSHLLLLRLAPDGINWIFLLLVIVMTGDSAAYYTGSTIGRRKLYPAVSPNKSIEGAMGGLAGSLVGALVFRQFAFPELSVVHCVLVALPAAAMGQLGDLFESLLKRSCGVKDSGTIVPGHGGILDRLDSILFAVPVLYYYLRFVIQRG